MELHWLWNEQTEVISLWMKCWFLCTKCKSLSPRHGAPLGCRWRNGLQIWWVALNILNKRSSTADKEWSSRLGVGRGACYYSQSSPITLQNISQDSDLDWLLQNVKDVYRDLAERPEGKRPLGRPRCRGEVKITMDLQEAGWRAWTGLIWRKIGTGSGLLWTQ